MDFGDYLILFTLLIGALVLVTLVLGILLLAIQIVILRSKHLNYTEIINRMINPSKEEIRAIKKRRQPYSDAIPLSPITRSRC